MSKPYSWTNILLATGLLVYQLSKFQDRWHSTLFKVVFVFSVLWTLYEWGNFFTRGGLSKRLFGSDDLEVPPNFDDYCLKNSVSPHLKLHLSHLMDGGSPHDQELTEEQSKPGIATAEDAMALCSAFQQASDDAKSEMLPLFLQCKSQEAYQHLYKLGMPIIFETVQLWCNNGTQPKHDPIFSCLRILCGFGYTPAASFVCSLTQDAAYRDRYEWFMIFPALDLRDPDSAVFLKAFTAALPQGTAGEMFVDWANQVCIKGKLKKHPYDTSQGHTQLRQWLTQETSEPSEVARAAACALAFLGDGNTLMSIAKAHADPHVRMEAAWASIKRGNSSGVDELLALCQDWRTRGRAITYLEELNLSDRLPATLENPRERAMGEVAEWLSHPNELGSVPDTLEIIDHRTIVWPPANERLAVSLLRWTKGEDSGIAMCGSVTWCFFMQKFPQDQPLEIYAFHCQWEFDDNRLGSTKDSRGKKISIDEAKQLLLENNPNENWVPTS